MRLSLILALIGLLVALVGAPSATAAHRVAAAHECADCTPHAQHGGTDMAAPCPHPGLCIVASLPAPAEAAARGAARPLSFGRHRGDPALPAEPSPGDRPPRA
ncbi:hypothetical protein [Albidovulum sp.]|jgi:hypothetical protein|uniref:hypothetical protein n=1 Tax=Albidovulum sp. TaxID=1872424 RepID=UPI00306C0C9E